MTSSRCSAKTGKVADMATKMELEARAGEGSSVDFFVALAKEALA